MGLSFPFSSARRSAQNEPALGEPNPAIFRVLSIERGQRYALCRVAFTGCATFNGEKLLVFANEVLDRVLLRGRMDPHFLEHEDSPLARFVPTPDGERAARAMMAGLERKP